MDFLAIDGISKGYCRTEEAEVRTTTAEKVGYVCPKCGDKLSRDRAGKGYVRHLSDSGCRYENGMKDSRVG